MTKVTTALVIGGGVAGPVMAMALQKAGIEATVYEAYSAATDTIGGMLTVAPNGLEALAIVDADEAVRSVGQPMSSMIMADGRAGRSVSFLGLMGCHRAGHCGASIFAGCSGKARWPPAYRFAAASDSSTSRNCPMASPPGLPTAARRRRRC